MLKILYGAVVSGVEIVNEVEAINIADTLSSADILSGVISILTIISSAVFLYVNIRVNRKNAAREIQRQVFSNFYLPIKFKLGYIINILESHSDVSIFEKKENDALYEKRRDDILLLYQNFLDWILKEQYCYSKEIDKLIFETIEHMQFVIVYRNDVKQLNSNRNKYPIPDFAGIIKKIDSEFEKGKFV